MAATVDSGTITVGGVTATIDGGTGVGETTTTTTTIIITTSLLNVTKLLSSQSTTLFHNMK